MKAHWIQVNDELLVNCDWVMSVTLSPATGDFADGEIVLKLAHTDGLTRDVAIPTGSESETQKAFLALTALLEAVNVRRASR